jgi:hypothetical protein
MHRTDTWVKRGAEYVERVTMNGGAPSRCWCYAPDRLGRPADDVATATPIRFVT